MRIASERLPATVHATQQLLADMQRAVHEIEGAAVDLRAMENRAAPQFDATLANARRATESLAATSAALDQFISDNEPVLSRFTSQSLPEFEKLLRESRAAARDFRDLSRSLKQNPSQLLYEPNYRGVEVPR
jgi:ABC-type transporter Mla subunit MlaD